MTKELLKPKPHEADPMNLVSACLALCVVNTHKFNWFDILCIVAAAGNIALYAYRYYRFRLWKKHYETWLAQYVKAAK